MNVNWNLYRLFYYVARFGSTSIASKKLFVAQPSVSRGIKQLESDLGCALFERSYQGMTLTESGKLLYDHIESAVNAIEEAEEELERKRHGSWTEAHVAVIDTTMQFFLLPHLEAFRAENPQVYTYIHQCTDVPDAEALLDSNIVDFAIMCETSTRDDLVNIPVRKVSDVLICASEYRSQLGTDSLSVQELAGYPLITLRKNSPSRALIDRYFLDNNTVLSPKYEFSHVSSILRQIKYEFALAFVLEDTVRHELETGSFFRIELTPPPPSRLYYLIKPKKLFSQASGLLADHLIHHGDLL